MLDEKLKQRLVGASVLVAVAVIFLPSFFHKDERISIDTATQIPPAPMIAPVVIPQPVKPAQLDKIAPPPADQLFQPKVMASSKPRVGDKPRLTKTGVPVGWVVQVASLKSEASAQKLTAKLIQSAFKAYHQSVKTKQGAFFRVFVGPFIDKSLANNVKQKVDKQYKVESRILRFNPVSGN